MSDTFQPSANPGKALTRTVDGVTYQRIPIKTHLITKEDRMADVLERAWQKGCRFEAWSECFRYDLWTEAFAECGVDKGFYAYRARPLDEAWPWQHIDVRVRQEFFRREYE